MTPNTLKELREKIKEELWEIAECGMTITKETMDKEIDWFLSHLHSVEENARKEGFNKGFKEGKKQIFDMRGVMSLSLEMEEK